MNSSGFLTVFGIACLITGLLMLAGGIVLLVFSIRSTIGNKKRIGGIVWGSILIVLSIMAFLYGIIMLILNGAANTVAGDRYTNQAGHDITEAIDDKDPELLAELFASKSFSGDEIEEDDAEDLISYIDGDVKSVDYIVTGFSSRNSTTCVTYKFEIKTSEEKYTLYIDCITHSSKDSYLGIQHALLRDRSGKVCEFGKTPDLD